MSCKGTISTKVVENELIKYVKNYYQINDSNVIAFCDKRLREYTTQKPFISNSWYYPNKNFGKIKPDVAFYAIHRQRGEFGIIGEAIGKSEYQQSSSSNSIAHMNLKRIYNKKCNVYLAQKVMVQLFSLYIHFKNFLNVKTINCFFAGEIQCQKDISLVLKTLKDCGRHVNQYTIAPTSPHGYQVNSRIIIYKIVFPDDIVKILNELSV